MFRVEDYRGENKFNGQIIWRIGEEERKGKKKRKGEEEGGERRDAEEELKRRRTPTVRPLTTLWTWRLPLSLSCRRQLVPMCARLREFWCWVERRRRKREEMREYKEKIKRREGEVEEKNWREVRGRYKRWKSKDAGIWTGGEKNLE